MRTYQAFLSIPACVAGPPVIPGRAASASFQTNEAYIRRVSVYSLDTTPPRWTAGVRLMGPGGPILPALSTAPPIFAGATFDGPGGAFIAAGDNPIEFDVDTKVQGDTLWLEGFNVDTAGAHAFVVYLTLGMSAKADADRLIRSVADLLAALKGLDEETAESVGQKERTR